MARPVDRMTLSPLELPTRMAASDALFWYAEQVVPEFRAIIGGLYLLDRSPDPLRLEAGTDAALALVPRLRQRVVEARLGLGLPEWEEVAHVDRSYHLRHVSVPAPGSLRQVLDLTGAVFATPFDRERPLWEATVIDGLEGGRSAFFFKLHHAVVDGVGSLALLRALTQASRDEPVLQVPSPGKRAKARRGRAGGLLRLALDEAEASGRFALRAGRAPLELLSHPGDFLGQTVRTLRGIRGVVEDLFKAPIRDPLAAGSSGLSRRLDVMEIPLERLRRIRAPLGVTINDVVLAALAGALGRYHRERRVRVERLNCLVPMNLRGREEEEVLGNRVGAITVGLPVGERSAERRLAAIVEQTRAAKTDRRGAAFPFLVEALPWLPAEALRWLARSSLGRVNVACTNIPGIPERRYMAGAEIEAIHPFASVVQGTPLVVALLSYAGAMEIGIDTDPEAIPDAEHIAALLRAGVDEMEALASGSGRRRSRGSSGRRARSAGGTGS
jgi:diacylglycerol O-acyltransferase